MAKYIVGKKTKMLWLIFAFFFIFPLFQLSLQCNSLGNLCQRFLRNYCASDFEIWYKCWVWLVILCKRKPACFCLSFHLFVYFSFSPSECNKFLIFYESLQILYKHWEWPSILWDRKHNCFHFAFFFLFSISHSNVIHREICDKYFSGTIAHRSF